MIRILRVWPDNVLAVEAVGTVSEDDYEQVLAPALAGKLDEYGALRFVYVLAGREVANGPATISGP